LYTSFFYFALSSDLEIPSQNTPRSLDLSINGQRQIKEISSSLIPTIDSLAPILMAVQSKIPVENQNPVGSIIKAFIVCLYYI
jgi:hypothetical protein